MHLTVPLTTWLGLSRSPGQVPGFGPLDADDTATLAAGLWHGGTYGTPWLWQWVTSLVGAAVTFAIGLVLRHRNVPAPLAWLGLVSYSVYLLHPLVVNAYSHLSRHLNGASTGVQIVIAFGIAATVLLVSAAAYYCVEKPMQKAGRWVTARTNG